MSFFRFDKTTLRNLGLLIGALLVVGGLSYWLVSRSQTLPSAPLARVPKGAIGFAHLDVAALTASPVWAELTKDNKEKFGLARIQKLCGLDPTKAIKGATGFVSGKTSLDRFGFVLEGDLPEQTVAACVRKLVESGPLDNVQIEGLRGLSTKTRSSQVAFVDGAGLVGGDEVTVKEAARVIKTRAESGVRNDLFARLWQAVGPEHELTLLLQVPDSWRPTMSRIMSGALAPVQKTVAFALAMRLEAGLGLDLVLEAKGTRDARDIRQALEEQVRSILTQPMIAMTPFGSILGQIKPKAEGRHVKLALSIPMEQLKTLGPLLRGMAPAALRGAAGAGGAMPPPGPRAPLQIPAP